VLCDYFNLQRTRWFQVLKTFQRQRTISSRSLEKIRIKELPSPNYLKTLKNQQFSWKKQWRTSGFMGSHFSQNVENNGDISEPIFWFFWEPWFWVLRTTLTTYQVSVPICSNHPTWILMWIYLIRIEKSTFSRFREGKTRFTLLHYCVLFEGHLTCQIDRMNRLGMHRCSFFSNRLRTYTC
jgi:hypothetical protein